jgi:hypothetical protein
MRDKVGSTRCRDRAELLKRPPAAMWIGSALFVSTAYGPS